MRVASGLSSMLLVLYPAIAGAQSFVVQGSAGPTLMDAGHSVAVGIGVSPTSHLTLIAALERTHLSSRVDSLGGGDFALFRGGTVTVAAAELRVALLGRYRSGPYALAGFAFGRSRPNVNEWFRDPVTNGVRAMFYGAGFVVPLRHRFSVFVDGRIMAAEEAGEVLAVAPVRVGVAWRF